MEYRHKLMDKFIDCSEDYGLTKKTKVQEDAKSSSNQPNLTQTRKKNSTCTVICISRQYRNSNIKYRVE